MTIKELFDKAENGTLTYEQFAKLASESNVKLVDLNEGAYVSKNKFDSELEAKTKEIEALNKTISTRDTDLTDLKKKLADAGEDSGKLTALTAQLADLQSKYETESKAHEEQLAQQAYDFAVKEYASTKTFSSQAAKRDFIRSLQSEKLKMKDGMIVGADDFAKLYATENADAFVVKSPDAGASQTSTSEPKPQFAGPTPGANPPKKQSLLDMMKAANENPGSNTY